MGPCRGAQGWSSGEQRAPETPSSQGPMHSHPGAAREMQASPKRDRGGREGINQGGGGQDRTSGSRERRRGFSIFTRTRNVPFPPRSHCRRRPLGETGNRGSVSHRPPPGTAERSQEDSDRAPPHRTGVPTPSTHTARPASSLPIPAPPSPALFQTPRGPQSCPRLCPLSPPQWAAYAHTALLLERPPQCPPPYILSAFLSKAVQLPLWPRLS